MWTGLGCIRGPGPPVGWCWPSQRVFALKNMQTHLGRSSHAEWLLLAHGWMEVDSGWGLG